MATVVRKEIVSYDLELDQVEMMIMLKALSSYHLHSSLALTTSQEEALINLIDTLKYCGIEKG